MCTQMLLWEGEKEMQNKKTSWYYQKNRYRQISLKFFIEDNMDMLLFHHLSSFDNKSEYLKKLIREDMWKRAYEEN